MVWGKLWGKINRIEENCGELLMRFRKFGGKFYGIWDAQTPLMGPPP